MSSIKLDKNGVVGFGRMEAWTPGRIDLSPPKRINRIRELLQSKSPKICVVRGEGIGDVIMTLPTVKALKKLFSGNVEIVYATNTAYLDGALVKVLKFNPDISSVIDRDNLDESDYDCVINLHCPAIAHEKPGAVPINRIDLFARHTGFGPLEDPVPHIYLTEQELGEGSAFLYRSGLTNRKTVMVNLFASSSQRSIDSRVVRTALTRLYEEHKIHSLVVTHNSDKPTDIVWTDIPGSIVVRGKDVRELAAIMVHCDLLLCPDSALLHVGGCLGVPTVSLFGPTDPRARINYYSNAVAIWEGEHLSGHPHWYEACPYGNLCWKLITDEHIVSACVQHIGSSKKASTVPVGTISVSVI